jgi:4-amino-4-deoxy-L-arabinose transferase-like glycosyltransferase
VTEIKWINRLTYIAIVLLAGAAALFCITCFIEPDMPISRQKFLGFIYLFCLFGGVLLLGWIKRRRLIMRDRK